MPRIGCTAVEWENGQNLGKKWAVYVTLFLNFGFTKKGGQRSSLYYNFFLSAILCREIFFEKLREWRSKNLFFEKKFYDFYLLYNRIWAPFSGRFFLFCAPFSANRFFFEFLIRDTVAIFYRATDVFFKKHVLRTNRSKRKLKIASLPTGLCVR